MANMPRRGVLTEFWAPHVRLLLANEPQLKNLDVLDRLGKDMAAHPDRWREAKELPSERVVGRIRQSFQAEKPEVRQQYRYVRWPESFGTPDLPWEAAAAVMDLMRLYADGERPTVRVAALFWRVTLAAPDAPLNWRERLAGDMVSAAVAGDAVGEKYLRGVERIIREKRWLKQPSLEPQDGPVHFAVTFPQNVTADEMGEIIGSDWIPGEGWRS